MTEDATVQKKICIVTPEFPPDSWGGLARSAERVADHAFRMGLSVHVAQFMVMDSPGILLDENRLTRCTETLTLHRLTVGKETLPEAGRQLWDCPHTLTLQMMYQSLEMLHAAEEFHLFHSFFLYPVGYVTGLLARRKGVPHVATLVGNDIKRYIFSPEKAGVCRSGLENADRVVGLSRDLLEMAHALCPILGKAGIVYNSVEMPAEAWEPRPLGEGPFRIGCAGIFKYAKGLPYLLKAVAVLKESYHVALELVGFLRESEREIFRSMVQRTGIEDLLLFRDAIPHGEMTGWLRTLDVFVLPSLTEGCPNILMEAMASGLPCVATRTGAADELMEDRVSGLLVPWGSSSALVEAMETIMASPDLGASLGRAARSRMERFSRDAEREAWKRVYEELMDF